MQTGRVVGYGLAGVSAIVLFVSCGGGTSAVPPSQPPTVNVSVQASDAFGNALTYEWRVTEGSIVNANTPSTTWTLPAGPGLHFAYVLISNGKGGYSERRLAVSTDSIGIPPVSATPMTFDAPAANAPTGVPYRSVIRGNGYYNSQPPGPDQDGIYIPDASVYLQNTVTLAKTATVQTDVRGSFRIDDIVPGTYDEYCTLDPGVAPTVCAARHCL